MAGRNHALWDLHGSDGWTEFEYKRVHGERVVSYSLYGTLSGVGQDDLRHAFVWQPTSERIIDQRMSREPLDMFEMIEELQDMREQGYHAAYLGAVGSRFDQRFSAIYERDPSGGRPEVILGAHWFSPYGFSADPGSFTARLEDAREHRGLYARSVGVFGAPRPADFGVFHNDAGARDTTLGLFMVATLWPVPRQGFGWGVHLTPNRENRKAGDDLVPTEIPPASWKSRWETRALAVQAYPVAGTMTASLAGYGSFTLSLWHDVRYVPWPVSDPFSDPDEHPTFRVTIVAEPQLQGKLDLQRNNYDRAPLSIGASFDGGVASFFVPYGRPGTEEPLPRKFVRRGIGQSGGAMPVNNLNPVRGRALGRWVRSYMRATGARQAQLVVVRRGWLAHAAAYTWAEDGYPVATLGDALRLASVSKMLSAFMMWARIIPQLPQKEDTLISHPDLLAPNAAVVPPWLAENVTVGQLLCHNSGFGDGEFWSQASILDQMEGPIEDAAGLAYRTAYRTLSAGIVSKYLQARSSADYFYAEPGSHCSFKYVNQGPILLGECAAKLLVASPELYGRLAVEHLLKPVGVAGDAEPLYARGWDAARKRSESPAHDSSPRTAWNAFEPNNTHFPMVSTVYAGWDSQVYGAAGGWGVPLLTVARILSRLSDRPGNPVPYLDRAGLLKMAKISDATDHAACPDSDYYAFGCFRQLGTPRYNFNRNLGTPGSGPNAGLAPPVIRIYHSGLFSGCASLLAHQFPADPLFPGTEPGDTLSICFATNLGPHVLGDADVADLFKILQEMEFAPAPITFPDYDLFDDL